MTSSPDLGLPLIASQQNQPEVTHNEAVRLIAALLNGVISRGTNTPPGAPVDGDAYIIGAAPTGAWAGRANRIAVRIGTAWLFVPFNDSAGTPLAIGARQEGLRVYVRDEDAVYTWTGSAWAIVPTALPSFAVAGVPSAAIAGRMIYVTDETGGAVPAFSDGTNWLRVTDRATISS